MRLYTSLYQKWKKYSTALLLIFWVTGSVLGFFFARADRDELVPLVRLVVSRPVSISGILVVDVLPFLVCTLAVFSSEFWLIPVFGGMKSFAFSYNACAVSMAFGRSGWLIRWLLMFSDMLLIPALCVFCVRYLSDNRPQLRREWYIWFLFAIVIGCLDYRFVSSFLASLF